MFLPPRYVPPAYLPGRLVASVGQTSSGTRGPYIPGSYCPGSYLAPQLVAGPIRQVDGEIVLFTDQLATFVNYHLGIFAYRDKLPSRNTLYPLLSYTLVAGDNVVILSGPSGMAWVTIQFDCYSTTSFDADVLNERLRMLFESLVGMMGLVKVLNCLPSRPRASYTPAVDQSDQGVYRSSRDFKFQFAQP